MVLFEFALGNGMATAGLKVASMGASGAASSLYLPSVLVTPADLLALQDPTPLLQPSGVGISFANEASGGFVSGLLHSATSSISRFADFGPSLFGASVVSGAVAGVLHSCGVLTLPACLKSGEDEAEDQPAGMMSVLRPSLTLFSIVDTVTVGAILQSLGVPLDIPLRTWAAGGLLLSFPTSWFSHRAYCYFLKKRPDVNANRAVFPLELLTFAFAFAWLAWGTVLLSSPSMAMHAAPFLWWLCFTECVLTWSVATVSLSGMIVSTVVALLCQAK